VWSRKLVEPGSGGTGTPLMRPRIRAASGSRSVLTSLRVDRSHRPACPSRSTQARAVRRRRSAAWWRRLGARWMRTRVSTVRSRCPEPGCVRGPSAGRFSAPTGAGTCPVRGRAARPSGVDLSSSRDRARGSSGERNRGAGRLAEGGRHRRAPPRWRWRRVTAGGRSGDRSARPVVWRRRSSTRS
jgi:hypothetical protein